MTITQIKYTVAVAECKSMQEAARREFVSQPNLSGAIKALEEEIGIQIFERSRSGMNLTHEGREFVSYAKQVLEQYELLESRYSSGENKKLEFHVSSQHYAVAVNAFIKTIERVGGELYRFSIIETQTKNVIDDVKTQKSDIGIVSFSNYNKKIITKLIDESGLEFHELMRRESCVYLWKDHPLADRKVLSLDELKMYPCLVFEQGENTSIYFNEEAFGAYQYPRLISSNDRATSMECLIGLNGYAVGTGILCDSLNGKDYKAIPLKEKEIIIIGYVLKRGMQQEGIVKEYIEEMERQSVGL